jgi:hypothetical protein
MDCTRAARLRTALADARLLRRQTMRGRSPRPVTTYGGQSSLQNKAGKAFL